MNRSFDRVCLLLFLMSPPASVDAVGVYEGARPLDLNGLWNADVGLLEIEHNLTTSQFTARFADKQAAKCEHGGESRSFYLKGTLSQNTFEGEMQRCTDDPVAKEDCKMSGWVWTTKARGVISADVISADYRSQWYDYDRKEQGRYINCQRDSSGDRWKSLGTAHPECPKSNPDAFEIKINIESTCRWSIRSIGRSTRRG